MLDDSACRASIVARLCALRADSSRQWGKMTAPQMVCHLNDSFLGVMGDKPMKIVRFSWWRLTKPFALSGRMEWPHGVKTRPEFEQGISGTPPAQFDADLQQLLTNVERFTESPRAFEFRPHPLFGPMTEKQWMRWGYLHCDHHLRQFGQ